MTTGYVGNRHPGLRCLGQNCQLLVQRVTPSTLDAGKNFDSINIRHSRMTRLTPSPSLCSYVRSKRGLLHAAPATSKTGSRQRFCAKGSEPVQGWVGRLEETLQAAIS